MGSTLTEVMGEVMGLVKMTVGSFWIFCSAKFVGGAHKVSVFCLNCRSNLFQLAAIEISLTHGERVFY